MSQREQLVENAVDAMYRHEAWSSFWSREEARKLVDAVFKSIKDSGFGITRREAEGRD